METCMHCGRACRELQGILVIQRDGSGWYTKCCETCRAAYQSQNARERDYQRKRYARRR